MNSIEREVGIYLGSRLLAAVKARQYPVAGSQKPVATYRWPRKLLPFYWSRRALALAVTLLLITSILLNTSCR